MQLGFSWEMLFDGYAPVCTSDAVDEDGISPLSCLLMDDGGMGFLASLPWLNEGVERVVSVKSGRSDCADWSRDAWGVEIARGKAIVHSLYDENCSEAINIDSFEKALRAWVSFIQSKPEVGIVQRVEI